MWSTLWKSRILLHTQSDRLVLEVSFRGRHFASELTLKQVSIAKDEAQHKTSTVNEDTVGPVVA